MSSRKLSNSPYEPKKCFYCEQSLRPTSPNQQFHPECKKLWRKRYERDYSRIRRAKIKQQWEDTTPLP